MFDELEEKNIDSTPVELSQEELDGISGGISIFFSGSTFEGSNMFTSQRRGSRRRGRSSTFGSSRTSSSAFQVIGLGLNSPADVMSFFSGLAGLFRRG
jgi:hypothetical protein